MECSLPKVLMSLESMCLTGIREVVVSGGEPFANLEGLEQILQVTSKHGKKVFINTSFPKGIETKDAIDLISKYRRNLCGINVSRHVETVFRDDDAAFLSEVNSWVPVRINRLVDEDSHDKISVRELEDLVGVASKFSSSLNFRWDYRKLSEEQLHTINNAFLGHLFEAPSLSYVRSGGCLVCDTFVFHYSRLGDTPYEVRFHRGLPSTFIRKGNYGFINDIVVFPDGTVRLDWDIGSPTLISYVGDALHESDVCQHVISVLNTAFRSQNSIPSDLGNLAELLTTRTKNPYDVSSWKEISHYPPSFTDNREYEPKCGGGGSCGG
jgi:organic radical activating enzyme